MFQYVQQVFREWARSGPKSDARPRTGRCLNCETLEDRTLLSVSGAETLVNTTLTKKQSDVATASSPIGRSVAVWTEAVDSYNLNIKAQIFDSAGRKVGKEIAVTTGREREYSPAVGMDSKGNFVIVWAVDFDVNDADIYGARYSSTGTRLGTFKVASYWKNEFAPSIAVAGNGTFVVSYTYQFNTTDQDVKASVFRSNGTLLKNLDISVSSRKESQSSVAFAPDGKWFISYIDTNDVYVQQYSSTHSLLRTVRVTKTSTTEATPDLTVDSRGNAVVVFQAYENSNWNVKAAFVKADGTLGAFILVQATSSWEFNPSVTIDPKTGKIVVAYQVKSSSTATTSSVKVTELSSTGKPLYTAIVASGVEKPEVHMLAPGKYFVSYQSPGKRGSDPDGGIFGRIGTL